MNKAEQIIKQVAERPDVMPEGGVTEQDRRVFLPSVSLDYVDTLTGADQVPHTD